MRRLYLLLILALLLPSISYSVDKAFLRWMHDKPVIDSIVIEGNNQISSGEIKSQMYSKERSIWSAIKGDRRSRLQRETLTRDTMEIKYLYLINGFLSIRVSESFEIIGVDSSALIRVNIHEGTRFRFGPKKITGSFDPKFSGSLHKISNELKEGKVLNPFDLSKAVFDMKTVLANSGYPYATIDYTLDTISSQPLVPITFHIEPDSIVYFGELEIEGVESYPVNVARREVTIKQGDIYKRQKILDSQRRLFESGYFSYPQLGMNEDSPDRLRPDFVLKVRERKPRFINVTTGAGQSEVKDLQWDFSAGYGKRNLFGSRKFNVYADYSFSLGQDSRLITHRYRLRYTEPWFIGIRMPLSLTGEYEPPLRSKFQNYRIRSYAFSISTFKKYGEEFRFNTGLEYNNVKITDFQTGSEELIRQEEGISIWRKIYGTFRMDSRDNIFVPRKGAVIDFSTEYYGGFLGGDDSFTKIEASWSTYQKVWPGWIGAVRLKGGWAEAFGESDAVPTEELFYLGGANTIRGFTENSLGPQILDSTMTDSTAAGGKYEFIFNLEFRWKTVQLFNKVPFIGPIFKKFPLWQSLFFDMGNSFERPEDIRFDMFAYSYGTGFQVISPAGPIRIDYARSIKSPRYEVASRWHFTILYPF